MISADANDGRDRDGRLSGGRGTAENPPPADNVAPEALQMDYHHPLEDWLGRRAFRIE